MGNNKAGPSSSWLVLAFRAAFTLGHAIMIGTFMCGIITQEVQGFSTVSFLQQNMQEQRQPNAVLYNSYLEGLAQTESFASVSTTEEIEEESLTRSSMSETRTRSIRAQQQKRALLQLLGGGTTTNTHMKSSPDPVLADPLTKEPLFIRRTTSSSSSRRRLSGPLLGNGGSVPISLTLQTNDPSDASSSSRSNNNVVYRGRTDTYLNLLEPVASSPVDDHDENGTDTDDSIKSPRLNLNAFRVFVPPPLRSVFSSFSNNNNNKNDDDKRNAKYIPMRDLFTSPAVSFAYERGWRQGFAAAGFPGADTEYELVRDYFRPLTDKSVVVDMSCATGLFTRRLANGGEFGRVLGCDYSEAMLMEARRRIQAESFSKSSSKSKSKLQLVRCDVGQIPMQTASVPAVHAGAAMHCWPDLPAALSEIYRVLQPGGRYFASTFLSSYFTALQLSSSSTTDIQSQAFQYFESTDMIQSLLVQAGFESENIQIEILGNACIIIRCEK
eukprot:scaffold132545_cov47-Attheya_sp.AAC.2